MRNKIIVIGKNGLLGSNLNSHLKHKNFVSNLGYKEFIKKDKKFVNKFDYIINSTSNFKFTNNKYQKKNDFDLNIANKIQKLNIKLIMLSSRKVYKIGINLKESSALKPKDNYSINKLISEKNLQKILNDKILILRISNIIGLNKKKSKKLHKTFFDIFYENIKKGLIFNNQKEYKDFISIDKFCEIVEKLIKINAVGVFNISIGKKVFLKDIVEWLTLYNKKNLTLIKIDKKKNNDSFTLNNNKLMNTIKIKNSIQDLKKYCIKLSKELFKND